MNVISPLAPGRHAILIDGIQQRYRVHGNEKGPLCVVHPGGPGVKWDYMRMPAVEKFMTVIYVEPIGTDLGSRLESHPHGYDIERYVYFLDEILKRIDVPKVLLLGHSHGGFVAQKYAVIHPGRLSGIILYDSAPAAGSELFSEAEKKIVEFCARYSSNREASNVMEAWKALGSISDEVSFRSVLQGLLPAYFANFWERETEFQSFRDDISGTHVASSSSFDGRDSLPLINLPTLILFGAYDVICGGRWASELQKGIKGAEVVEFTNSGHFAHIEEPAKFALTINEFARDLPSANPSLLNETILAR